MPPLVLNRGDFQTLSRIRLREARALLKSGHFDGAYYLAGYAVECALKSCIARSTRRHDFPDKNTVNSSYTHNLGELVKVAGLNDELGQESASSTAFAANWATVKDWTEASRYSLQGRAEAHLLLTAMSGKRGVVTWLRRHW